MDTLVILQTAESDYTKVTSPVSLTAPTKAQGVQACATGQQGAL